MSTIPGSRLGPYEIVAPLGAGGMGEVYKARDTRLDRIVAIKVLHGRLSSDPQFRDRFDREARAISALDHPHICALYDVGEQDGTSFLVMQYLEGGTLQDRLAKGALPLDQALQYAIQIADALVAAHRAGIVHRDLKPGNVMLTKSGAKLLDFGLARATGPVVAGPGLSMLPTTPPNLTAQGTILGTFQYMAPEQLEGQEADTRTDIFAFGAVVYEMLTGKKAFEGKSQASLIGAIMHAEPPAISTLQPLTPPVLDRVVRRSLAKDPDDRWQTARDLLDELKWVADGGPDAVGVTPVARRRGHERLLGAVATVGVMAVVVSLVGIFLYVRRVTDAPRVLKVSVLPPEHAALSSRNAPPALSPDGRRLAFVASSEGKDSLWIRDLDSLAAHPLPGTEQAGYPFWSPDSRRLAFFAGGQLKKIDVAGGPALPLCPAVGDGRGGSWSNNGVIVFAPGDGRGLFRVQAGGGRPTPVTALDQRSGEMSHRFPWFLPDGRHFLYTALNSDPEKSAVYVADLDSPNRQQVVTVLSNALYAPPGYLLFLREQTLMAQPFDAAAAKITGDAIPIAEQVDVVANRLQGQFSASQNSVLAYMSSGTSGAQLTWFDQSGKALETVGAPGLFHGPAISPDGNTVAVDRADPQTGFYELWLHDLTRGIASRLTPASHSQQNNAYPVWSNEGNRIAFSSIRDGHANLYQTATSGPAADEPLDGDVRSKRATDWSRDGRYVIETVNDPKTKTDIWVLPQFGDRKAWPYLQTESNEGSAKLSPNGQWLAYSSDETKRAEIYIQTFPTKTERRQVSKSGGNVPVWSRDGKELYFLGADGKLMAVEVKGGARFDAGAPRPLFDTRVQGGFSYFDVSKEGRFLIPVPVEQPGSVPITLEVNWMAGLKP
jgi:Tol biopolymer transport system component